MKKGITNNFLFLSPHLTIKYGQLSKRDVNNIKVSLTHKMGATALVIATIIFLLNIFMFLSMGFETNWNQIEKYGVTSFLAQVISIVGTIVVAVCEIISLMHKKHSKKTVYIIYFYCLIVKQIFCFDECATAFHQRLCW